MCMADDGDGWTFFHSAMRKAAKAHVCYDCDRAIERGERYEHSTGLLDSYWYNHHVCAHCVAARRWLDRVCGGWLYGGVLEDLADHWGEGYTDLAFGRLLVLARRRWRASRTGTALVVPIDVEWLVIASLNRQEALGHLGRDRWAA